MTPRGGPLARHSREASGVSAASEDHGRETAVGMGSAPAPDRSAPSDREGRRAARGLSEEHGPIRQERPSLVRPARLRPGPGERDVTPISRGGNHTQRRPRRETRRGEANASLHFGLTRETPPLGQRSTVRGPKTHNSRSAQARGWDGKSGFGLRPKSPRDLRRPITPGQHVHTYLVLKNASSRQNTDGSQ